MKREARTPDMTKKYSGATVLSSSISTISPAQKYYNVLHNYSSGLIISTHHIFKKTLLSALFSHYITY